MPQIEISGGVIILGSRVSLPGQAKAMTTAGTALIGPYPIQPLDVSIGTVSALALAEVLTSSTIIYSGSILTEPAISFYLSGVKQQMVLDVGVIGSGSIMVNAYSVQPQFATIFPLNAIDGTLASTGWVPTSTVPSAFRLFNNSPGNVPLSPVTALEFIPGGAIQTWAMLTMTFR